MTLDPQALLAYDLPELVQSYGPKDLALYGHSIGCAEDPLSHEAALYAGGRAGVELFPTMATVLASPGFWYPESGLGIDALRLVHGEQAINLLRPFPSSGAVRGKTRITGVVDKGAEKGALLYTEKTLRDVATGEVLAVTQSTTFMRGNGGFGGSHGEVPAEGPPMPEGPPDLMVVLPTRREQALLYRWNGDPNPLHFDAKTAEGAGFKAPILHGLCTYAMAARALLTSLCDGDGQRLRHMRARFSSVVYPGETLQVEIWRQGRFRARVVERDTLVLSNGLVEWE